MDVSVLAGSRDTGEILHPPAPIARSHGSGRTASSSEGAQQRGPLPAFFLAEVSELRKWQPKIRDLKQNLSSR